MSTKGTLFLVVGIAMGVLVALWGLAVNQGEIAILALFLVCLLCGVGFNTAESTRGKLFLTVGLAMGVLVTLWGLAVNQGEIAILALFLVCLLCGVGFNTAE